MKKKLLSVYILVALLFSLQTKPKNRPSDSLSDAAYERLILGDKTGKKGVGITDWQLDLSQKDILVEKNQDISVYVLNWIEAKKDYGTFCPYTVPCVAHCCCPTVTEANLAKIPTFEGTVDQLEIQGSRFSSPVHLLIDSGLVRELIFLDGCNSGLAPTAVIVIKDDGEIGLGSSHINKDSLAASVVLGINGITLIADAGEVEVDNDGRVRLNEDLEINNMCHVVASPEFGKVRENVLKLYSETPKKIVVKNGGVLDLCSFDTPNKVFEIGGRITLVLEPGATVRLNGGILRLIDQAQVVCTHSGDLDILTDPSSVASTDPLRVKFVGTGSVEFLQESGMMIDKSAYVGIETDDCLNETDLTFALLDGSAFLIQGDEEAGGTIQIGNTTNKQNASVSFFLTIRGEPTQTPLFVMGQHAFLGLGVGVADNTPAAHNNWLVGNLYNTKDITITIPNGAMAHNQTYPGSNSKAALLAILDSQDTKFTFSFDTIQSTILGGGNIALINSLGAPNNLINPVVEDQDFDYLNDTPPSPPFVLPGILSSKSFLKDMFGVHKVQLDNTGLGLYGYLKILYDQSCDSILATAAQDENNNTVVGYVTNGTIMRPTINSILGRRGTLTDPEFSWQVGVVGAILNYDSPAGVIKAFEMPADVFETGTEPGGLEALLRLLGL